MKTVKNGLGFVDHEAANVEHEFGWMVRPKENDRPGKRSVAPHHSMPKILPEIQEVVSHKAEEKIEEFLQSRDPHAFMKYYKWVLDRLEIPNECKSDASHTI